MSDQSEQASLTPIVRVDSHVHTFRSGDSRTPLDRVEAAAIESGIDVVCITDHGTTRGADEAAEAFETVRVVTGQECRTWAGEIIGLFLTERIPGNLQPRDVMDRIHAQGGLVYVPHPFCENHAGLREDFLAELADQIDIVEVHNAKATAEGNAEAEQFAATHSKPGVAASDAHYEEFVGRSFIEIPDFTDAKSFLVSLASPDLRLERGSYTYAESSWPKRV